MPKVSRVSGGDDSLRPSPRRNTDSPALARESRGGEKQARNMKKADGRFPFDTEEVQEVRIQTVRSLYLRNA